MLYNSFVNVMFGRFYGILELCFIRVSIVTVQYDVVEI